MSKKTALLIDTLSIQRYVFGSNKLKENVGASFIVEHLVYRTLIPKAMAEAGIDDVLNIDEWKENPDEYKLNSSPETRVEVGYIGGGNAFLIFQDSPDAAQFTTAYSRLIMVYFPGIKTAFVTHKFEYEEDQAYEKFRGELNKQMSRNRSDYPVMGLPFKHGIVDDCPYSNEAQELEISENSRKSIISSSSWTRISMVGHSQEWLHTAFKKELKGEFAFTSELDKLGQPEDKGYVAIVHADGNSIGSRFKSCTSLAETRKLSAGLATYAQQVMKELVSYIVNLFEKEGVLHIPEFTLEVDRQGRRILPIRPLIMGGDDFTFVCEGRMGVHLAEKLLEFMSTTKIDNKEISACAGVAIVHTKYPFYKAYQLANSLTDEAKNVSRNVPNSSWLHYMISTGGFAGTYEDIIREQYTASPGYELKNGPYQIGKDDSMDKFKAGMKGLQATQPDNGWPRNKIKDLRDTLKRSEAHRQYFLAEIAARNLKLPNDYEDLWIADPLDDRDDEDKKRDPSVQKSPFHDMVELLDFYPQELLNSGS